MPDIPDLIRDIEKDLIMVKNDVRELDYKIKSLNSKAQHLEKTMNKLEDNLVPKVKYELVEKAVFGIMGLIIMTVIGALLAQVII